MNNTVGDQVYAEKDPYRETKQRTENLIKKLTNIVLDKKKR